MTVHATHGGLRRHMIQRWSEPFDHEPATAYFSRLAGMNLQTSARVFAQEMGFDGRALEPADCLEAVRHLPIEGLEALVHATPVVTARTVRLLGATVRRKHWHGDEPRYCPGCIAESPHYRTYHGLVAFTTCPFHGCAIETASGGDDSLAWRHPSLAVTPTGIRVGRRLPKRDRPLPSFETWLLGQLGVTGVWTVPLLEDVSVREAIDTVEFLGRASIGGWSRRAPRIGRHGITRREVVEKGFAFLLGGRQSLEMLFENIASQAGRNIGPADCTWGLNQSFGWLLSALIHGERTSKIMPAVNAAAINVAKRTGSFGKQTTRITDEDVEIAYVHREEIGRRFNIKPKSIDKIARHLKLKPNVRGGRFVLYKRLDVELMHQEFDAALDREGTVERLGLSDQDFRALEREGAIKPFYRRGGATSKFDRFRHLDVEAIAHKDIPTIKPPNKAFYFSTSDLSRTTELCEGSVSAKVAKGQIKPVGRTPETKGFHGLIFSPDSLDVLQASKSAALLTGGRERTAKIRHDVSKVDASAILGVHATSVNTLIDQGYIEISQSELGDENTRIDSDSLENFSKEYTPATNYAAILGWPRHAVTLRLQAMGVPIHGLSREKTSRLVAFVSRSDMVRILDVSHDPLEKQDGWTKFWNVFSGHLLADKSIFRLVRAMEEPFARLLTGDRRTSCLIAVAYDSSTSKAGNQPGKSNGPPDKLYWPEIHRRIENLAYSQRCHNPDRNRDQITLDGISFDVSVTSRVFRQQRMKNNN